MHRLTLKALCRLGCHKLVASELQVSTRTVEDRLLRIKRANEMEHVHIIPLMVEWDRHSRGDPMSRTDTVYLPASEDRCEPTQFCPQSQTCARARAPIVTGASLARHSPVGCMYYLSVQQSRDDMARRKPAPEVKPFVKGLI